jgi:hypothetical protein
MPLTKITEVYYPDGTGLPEAPTLVVRSTILLTHPYDTPTTTVELKNPEFTNSEALNYKRIVRKTRGGTTKVFSDPDWGSYTTLNMSFKYLCQDDKSNLQTFLSTSIGAEVGLLDYFSQQWRGLITNPETVFQDGGFMNKAVNLIFEGDLV